MHAEKCPVCGGSGKYKKKDRAMIKNGIIKRRDK